MIEFPWEKYQLFQISGFDDRFLENPETLIFIILFPFLTYLIGLQEIDNAHLPLRAFPNVDFLTTNWWPSWLNTVDFRHLSQQTNDDT